MPMKPSVIRLLGALAPNTDDGTIIGTAKAAPATPADRFRNIRREHDVTARILSLRLRGVKDCGPIRPLLTTFCPLPAVSLSISNRYPNNRRSISFLAKVA